MQFRVVQVQKRSLCLTTSRVLEMQRIKESKKNQSVMGTFLFLPTQTTLV